MTSVETWALAARLLQYAAAAIVCGGSLFFLYADARRQVRWPTTLVRIAAGLGALGTLGWLMTQAGAIGEAPSDALDPLKVWSIAVDTGFGRFALARLVLLLLALAVTFAGRPGRGRWLALSGLGAAAAASFAWTGHGTRDEGLAGAVHLAADILHLLAASVWIGALVALAALVCLARRGAPGAAGEAVSGLVHFSGIGVAVVAVLVASGLVNSWFLIGPAHLGEVLTGAYGRVLLAKLAAFGLMLALAAANRYRHTPRLQLAGADSGRFRPVLASVLAETTLALVVLALVSWLGTLPPPIDG